MSAQYTPGPWTVRAAPQNVRASFTVACANGFPIADIVPASLSPDDRSETIGNAHLIAAAPDLLAALLAIVDEAGPQFGHDDGPGTINHIARLARLAIAKATKGA